MNILIVINCLEKTICAVSMNNIITSIRIHCLFTNLNKINMFYSSYNVIHYLCLYFLFLQK